MQAFKNASMYYPSYRGNGTDQSFAVTMWDESYYDSGDVAYHVVMYLKSQGFINNADYIVTSVSASYDYNKSGVHCVKVVITLWD